MTGVAIPDDHARDDSGARLDRLSGIAEELLRRCSLRLGPWKSPLSSSRPRISQG